MTFLIEVPVDSGGQLLVQASEGDLPSSLELATLRPGEIAARARESLEQALDQVKPAMNAVVGKLREVSADEVAVEFGIVLGAETGAVIAKGSAEVHFTVTLSWKRKAADRHARPGVPGPTAEQQPGWGEAGA